ncbi:MAG: hypothetical protein JXA33_10840 [Anaerolineae bacterium]|nr:hypothetical protein [Anaerolineae bacterium]
MHPQDKIIIPLIVLGFVMSMIVIIAYEVTKRWQYLRDHPEARKPQAKLPIGDIGDGKTIVVIDKNPAGCIDNLFKLTATSTMGCLTLSIGVSLLGSCFGLAVIVGFLAITGMTLSELLRSIGK